MSITETREFIIVGQDSGTSFTLWDVAPAPADPTKRDMALEEIGIDAHDAFGDVSTEYATNARAAVDRLVAKLRERYGCDDYALSPDSKLDNYESDSTPQPAQEPEPFGRAHALSATRDSGYRIVATSTPGLPHFNVNGLPARSPRETTDRVRAGVINSGLVWPTTNVLVRISAIGQNGTRVGVSGLDLAITCSVLAAAGQLSSDCLAGVAMVGEMGLDGGVRVPYGLPSTVSRIVGGGTRTVIVPKASVRDLEYTGARTIGVSSLDEALAVLTGHWHHPQGCAHCTPGGEVDPHQPCTSTTPCPACKDNGPAPF